MFEESENRILIVGQAKTGTTALFYRIRQSLPETTRCLFEPTTFTESSQDACRCVLAKVLIRNTKPALLDSFRSFGRRILIVRDPRDTLVSSVLYSVFHATEFRNTTKTQRLISLLEQKERVPEEIALSQVMDAVDALNPGQPSCLDSFLQNLDLFRQFHEDAAGYHTLKYEDLVQGQLGPTEEYLGFSLGEMAGVGPQVQRVTRTRSSGDWKNWLVSEDTHRLRPLLDQYLHQLGYQDDWTTSLTPQIRAEHCSQYAKRLLTERRQVSSLAGRVFRRLRLAITASVAE